MSWRFGFSAGRLAVLVAIGVAALLVTAVAVIPMAMVGGASMLFAAGVGCPSSSGSGATTQPAVTTAARNSIPADYLALFKKVGQQYGVPWVLLAGIGKVESNDGQSTLPGVHSGQNGFGAAGPMQIGIGGASTNTWGGTPVHPASQAVSGVATDENGDGVASVYEPADAIAGAAKYLLAHGVQNNVSGAIFAYNHLQSYVQAVLGWAGTYARGGYTESNTTTVSAPECLTSAQTTAVPNQAGLHRDRVRAGAAGQALPVGRHRPGRVRLLRPGDDGLPGGGHLHPADLAGNSGPGGPGSRPARSGPVTWCSSRARTARRPPRATSAWSSAKA